MAPSRRTSLPGPRKKRVALVLGGGGMKGFAHIGVLQALSERRIKPTLFAGTSIGAISSGSIISG